MLLLTCDAQKQQDPSKLNGGSALAMAGDGCVALAVDQRFGSGPQMVNDASPRKVMMLNSKLIVGLVGLESDVQSLSEELGVHVVNKNKDVGLIFPASSSSCDHNISPRAMSALTSNVLYSKRGAPFYCEPIIAGLELVHSNRNGDDNEKVYRSYLCSTDMIGAQLKAHDFVCAGAAKHSLYGTSEALWRPGLNPDELTRVCARAFMSALERDCLSGYGARIYVISKDGVVEHDILSRTD